jgi:hypothetical protein
VPREQRADARHALARAVLALADAHRALVASRSGIVSWSASKDRETAQRAPPGQVFGASDRPARARPTMWRHSGSLHSQGFFGASLMVVLRAGADGTVIGPGASLLAAHRAGIDGTVIATACRSTGTGSHRWISACSFRSTTMAGSSPPTSPQYMPSFELNKAVVQKAEGYGLDFALSMIKLHGFGGKTEFWDHGLESFTLMAALAPSRRASSCSLRPPC